MTDLAHYLDLAKARQDLKSDRQLDQAIGAKGCNTFVYRKGRAWPSDETMIKIARLAGEDAHAALVDLAIWRSGDAARVIWKEIAAKMRAA